MAIVDSNLHIVVRWRIVGGGVVLRNDKVLVGGELLRHILVLWLEILNAFHIVFRFVFSTTPCSGRTMARRTR